MLSLSEFRYTFVEQQIPFPLPDGFSLSDGTLADLYQLWITYCASEQLKFIPFSWNPALGRGPIPTGQCQFCGMQASSLFPLTHSTCKGIRLACSTCRKQATKKVEDLYHEYCLGCKQHKHQSPKIAGKKRTVAPHLPTCTDSSISDVYSPPPSKRLPVVIDTFCESDEDELPLSVQNALNELKESSYGLLLQFKKHMDEQIHKLKTQLINSSRSKSPSPQQVDEFLSPILVSVHSKEINTEPEKPLLKPLIKPKKLGVLLKK
ncbi:hypothetical protein RCL1_004174 [Eukaryota sp. TZLM3-RCL]